MVFAGAVLTHSEWYTSPVAALQSGAYSSPSSTVKPSAAPTAVAPVAAVPSSALPAVPPGWLVYVNRTWKYSIAYPPDWYQPPADPGGQDSAHYFSNENVAKHGVMDRNGIDLAVQARQQCLSVGGVRGAGVEPISFALLSVDGHPVTRYFDEFRPGSGLANGWNLTANVPIGGNCIQVGSFTYLRSVSEAMRPIFDQMVASLRPA